jgi:DNA-binding MarR family transcriptional regulator
MTLPRGSARRLMHGLSGAWRRLENRASSELKAQTGLALDDLVFLETIALTDLSPSEIAATLRIPTHGVSRRLAEFEALGAVRRTIDPSDNRRRTLEVTARGRSLIERAHAILENRVEPMLRPLGSDTSSRLLDALTRFAAGDDQDETPGG